VIPSISQQHKDAVRGTIRTNSALGLPYIAMNTLATIIACYGLFANSPAVVIGAMIVAMLLGPISGVGLALVDSDMALLRRALVTLLAGAAGVFVTALILGLLHRNIPLTNEIMARTAPNLFDLMVALAGGAAGAYATVSPRLSVAFVGVAIATALVPPLSSASILLARGEYQLGANALLLVLTNMVAIQFASSAVFWLAGFRRITRFRGVPLLTFVTRELVSMVVLAVLAVVLTRNLQRVISTEVFQTSVHGVLAQEIDASLGSYLVEVRFDTTQGTTIVRAVVRGPNPPSPKQVGAIEDKLPRPPDRTALDLRIRFVPTTIVDRNGILYKDAGFGSSE
jgi:uncharacterized hydrophobic protein (TIGR00271 family)